nr:hypothetical protein BaRGS_000788 [Batillaria attramentaria]
MVPIRPDVVVSLQEKLNIRCVHHFSLVLQNMKNNTGTAAKMTLLQDQETLADDAYDLLKEDPIAFEYFYLQCCNDVLHERFASEMKYDTALRLAALQIQQHAMSNNMSAKVSIKAVVKECGLDKFVSKSLMESMKGKDLKRMLAQYLKMNQSLAAPGQKHLTALQAKLHYMKIVSELKTFGSRVFMVTLLDKRTEAMLLVGPHSGVSIVTNIKSYALTQLADFEHIDHVKVTKDGENMHRVDLKLRGQRAEVISLGLLSEDAQNFVCMVAGYYRIFVDPDKRVVERTIGKNTTDPDVPSYESVHRVQAAPWSYPEDLVSEVVVTSDADVSDNERRVDLSQDPPEYTENQEYLAKIKQDLGIESGQRVSSNHLERPINVSTIVVSPALPLKSKVNGAASTPFEEGVTSFGTASSDSSSLGSSFSSQGNNSATVLHGGVTSLAAQPTFNTTIDLRRNPAAANGHATGGGMDGAVGLAESERSSDTDSLSTADTERRPLLGAGAGGGGQQNGEVRVNSVDGESDESDSFGTPSGSPAKARLIQRVSSVESGMHSFGLHSPDMLPAADVDFQRMDSLPPEVYSAIYNPGNMIPPQKLYFDPDIIDFTGPAFGHHGNTGASHRLERSASTGHCPDFFDTDIDSIIAQYYVPPPPSSSDTDSSRSQSFSGVMPRDSNQQPPSTIELDDDFSSLIIPPPPSTSQVEEVPVVPPAPSGAGERRRNFRHKRSSSVDIGSLNAAKKQLEEAEKRRSLDIQQQQSGESEARRNSPPHSLGVESAFDADVHGGLAAESPATVSLKLHNLLKSLPNFAPEVATANQQQQQQPFFRTGSLRIHRSSSLDVVPGPGAPGLNGHDPQMSSAAYGQRTMFAGTASLGRLSGRRAVSQERLFSQGVPMYGVNGAHVNGGHQDVGDTQQQQTPSESFASLKAKLKDYRDSLLKRSRKNSTSEDSGSETGDGGKKKSSLRRSNSFSRLLNQLSGRKGDFGNHLEKESTGLTLAEKFWGFKTTLLKITNFITTTN